MGNYLAKYFATVVAVVDKSKPAVAALYDAIPCSKRGRRREPRKTLLFNLACGLAHGVPLTKMVELDGNIHPYLTVLMVAVQAWTGEIKVRFGYVRRYADNNDNQESF